ncbi:O-antigen biosynthesis protein WbqP [Candidatus Brocadiaceae bacterium]|nr:O-antigen biosynthesis protein WbqP [Candidatus Brocadiaceae bacterium]
MIEQQKLEMSAHAQLSPNLAWLEAIRKEDSLFQGKAYYIVKLLFDIIVVLISLPLLVPILGLFALALKIEDQTAAVLFFQMRTGKGGRPFKMYKFRSMVKNAEAMKEQLMHLNELQWPDFKITNDPRITRVGRILRKTSLDELPQIFNVLRGEMSLVGPRPTSFSASTYALWQTERLDVLPGITGLWQVYGRASTEFDDRLRLDIAYIERCCIWLDIQILFRTIGAVLYARGAH